MNREGIFEVHANRLWRFGPCELDEMSRGLRVAGRAVELESKPLDVLLQLLLHAGEVVTKEELLEAAWPETTVVDGSLATAISKLRRALGEVGQDAILTVPRIGYRLAVPVECRVVKPERPQIDLQVNATVPGRDQWRLIQLLGSPESSNVWLAEHVKTHERRVFKFAWDGLRLKSLKREVTVARYLRESLGGRPEFVRVLEWNFTETPFFLESEYGGPDLSEWAAKRGGVAAVPLEQRLHLLAQVALAVAAAHDAGVLHKDLKPSNILVADDGDEPQVRVADFGSAAMVDPSRLGALGITSTGMPGVSDGADGDLSGTLAYLAPEVLAGQSPTASADIYALGVILYQLAVGDFRAVPAPGWEARVEDPLLRQDIAEAACGDSAERLSSAAELAERLLHREQRRCDHDLLLAARAQAAEAERRLAVERARRPWMAVAGIALVAGLAFSLMLYWRASRARSDADRQASIAQAINAFLSNDLLSRANPFQAGKADESFVEAVNHAAPAIDKQFSHNPLVAAHLHQTIARALDHRTSYNDARREYSRAAALFVQAEGAGSQNAAIARMQLAAMEARSYEQGSLDRARALVAEEEKLQPSQGELQPELLVWLESARGMVALIANNAQAAVDHFQLALNHAAALTDYPLQDQLTLEQRVGFAYIRLGNGAQAERVFRHLIVVYSGMGQSSTSDLLRARMNLAQAFMIEGKHADVIRETNELYPEFVQALGGDHDLTLQVLSVRVESEASLSHWEDALRDSQVIYDRAIKKHGPLSFYAISTLADSALIECRSGRLARGLAAAREAVDDSAKGFGVHAGLTDGVRYAVASCLQLDGKVEQAAPILEAIDISAVSQLTGDADWGANVWLAEAQIAEKRGQKGLAKSLLEKARPAFTKPQSELYQRQAFAQLEQTLGPTKPS